VNKEYEDHDISDPLVVNNKQGPLPVNLRQNKSAGLCLTPSKRIRELNELKKKGPEEMYICIYIYGVTYCCCVD